MKRFLKKLVGKNKSPHDEAIDTESHMVSPEMIDRLCAELAGIAVDFFNQHGGFDRTFTHADIRPLVDEFYRLYPQRPLRFDRKGSGFHNLFWIYLTLRLLKPNFIVESGVRLGQSSWILREAARDATIHSFDITLARLVYKDPKIQYHEQDWSTLPLGKIDPATSVGFFDDHQDEANRVREAHERGFRTLIMDDSPAAHQLYRFGMAGTPTVPMVLDQTLKHGQKIEWNWRGQVMTYVHDADVAAKTAKLIKHAAVYPDVGNITGWDRWSFMAFVRLND